MTKTRRYATALGKVLGGASLTAVLQDIWRSYADLSGQQRRAFRI